MVAAGIGGKEKDMKTEEICWSILKSIMVEFFTLSSEEGKNRLINVINNDFREILNAWDRDKVRQDKGGIIMMPKQLPNVMNDKGYQKDAHDFAKKIMECKGILGPCKDMNHFQEWMEEALSRAYLYGAQSAVRVGYLLADKDWEETYKGLKKEISELKQQIEED